MAIGRPRSHLLGTVCVLFGLVSLGAGRGLADSSDRELPSEARAVAVAKAHADGDVQALGRLAVLVDEARPWMVVEALLAGGHLKAAVAFARAVPVGPAGGLAKYAKARASMPTDGGPWSTYKAIVQAAKAKDISRVAALRTPDTLGDAPALRVAATVPHVLLLINAKQSDAAQQLLTKMIEETDTLVWPRLHASALKTAGVLEYQRRQIKSASAYWARAVPHLEAMGDPGALRDILNNVGMAHQALGQLEDSRTHLVRALSLAEQIGRDIASTSCNLAITLRRMGHFSEAAVLFRRAITIYRKRPEGEQRLALALGDLGGVYVQQGALAKAVHCYEESIELKTKLGMLGSAVNSRIGLASTLTRLRQHDRALGLLSEVEPLMARQKSLRTKGAFTVTLAAAERRSGRPQAAATRLRAAAPLFQAPEHRAVLGALLANLVSAQIDLKELVKAEATARQAHKVFAELGDDSRLASVEANLGLILAGQGELAGALPHFRKAVELADAAGATEIKIRVQGLLASHLNHVDQPKAAVAVARRAIEASASVLGGHADLDASIARSGQADLYDVAVIAAHRSDDLDALHYFLESGRAAALLESLGGRSALAWLPIPEALREAEAAAFNARVEAGRAFAKARRNGTRSEVSKAFASLNEAERRLAAAGAALARGGKAAAHVAYPRPEKLSAIRHVLTKSDVLVTYAQLDEEILALVATHDGARVVVVGDAADLRVLAAAVEEGNPVESKAALVELRKTLVSPLGLPNAATRLLVSPSGALTFVPFPALFSDTVHGVCFVPSGTAYLRLRSNRAPIGKGVLAIGDPDYREPGHGTTRASRTRLSPLPATRDEAKSVGDVVLLGADATPTNVLAHIAKRPRWAGLHFACHGVLNTQDPYGSALALTPDAETGGHLSVRDIMRASPSADLVVLSACESGRGRVIRGEGVFGLVRAFLLSGSSSVVASLWKVDDEATAALMKAFYAGVKQGRAVDEALLAAQRSVRDQTQWAHPKYWAAWVVWGLPN